MLQCFSVRFLFYFFIWFSLKLSFLFYFLILSWLKITATICEESTVTFLTIYCGLLQCFFPHDFFFVLLCFSLKLSFSILFFKIISWLRIAITSKYKFFLTKHYGLIQFFLTWFFSSFFCVFFFCDIFFQNYLRWFFLILSWLEFNFVIKLNHMRKTL